MAKKSKPKAARNGGATDSTRTNTTGTKKRLHDDTTQENSPSLPEESPPAKTTRIEQPSVNDSSALAINSNYSVSGVTFKPCTCHIGNGYGVQSTTQINQRVESVGNDGSTTGTPHDGTQERMPHLLQGSAATSPQHPPAHHSSTVVTIPNPSSSGTHVSQHANGDSTFVESTFTNSSTQTAGTHTPGVSDRHLLSFLIHMCEFIELFGELIEPLLLEKEQRDEQWLSVNTTQFEYQQTHLVPGNEPEKCSVCLEEFQTGESLRRLSCQHNFHSRCIESWVLSHKKCPNCRTSFNI